MKVAKILVKNLYKYTHYLYAPLTDRFRFSKDIKEPLHVKHSQWKEYLYKEFAKPGISVLEIGSREVTGESLARNSFKPANYLGFDYYPGANVDRVGDVHKLSSYFSAEEKFDLIYSSACFEHFAMPWLVAEEISKLLKVGGTIFVETHFSFASHERPWHFFQYSDMALRALFSPALGFETIDGGMCNPISGRFAAGADSYLRFGRIPDLYCHSSYLGKKVREVPHFSWNQVDIQEVVGKTEYPKPKIS